MEKNVVIDTFTQEWWIYTFIVTTSIVCILWFFGKQKDTLKKHFMKVLFIIAAILIASWQVYFVISGTWTADVSLPFHLCGISKICGAVLLLKYNQKLFEFVILLGTAGALQAILTPQFEIEITPLSTVEYYMSHGMIILMPLYLFYVMGHRVEKGSWLSTYIIGVIILILVGVANYIIDANYIFLCAPPVADNPLLLGPWPYYLTGYFVLGFINIVLFYRLFRWWGKKLDRKKEVIVAT